MTWDDAKGEGYLAALEGRPSYIAPNGYPHRAWMSGWIDGYIERNQRSRESNTQSGIIE